MFGFCWVGLIVSTLYRRWHITFVLSFTLSFVSVSASAQSLPGPADPGRIVPSQPPEIRERPPVDLVVPDAPAILDIPDAAEGVFFNFKQLNLVGVTAFSESELADIYRPYLGREISLEIVWTIAGAITERYFNEGYFLSRAYVPAQQIDDGIVTIEVVEGRISRVELNDELAERSLLQQLIARLQGYKPVKAYDLESFMLQLNALPGVRFRGLLEPLEDAPAGFTKLVLQPIPEDGTVNLLADNFGSNFLGPYQSSAFYEGSIIPLQQTQITASASLPADELKYIALSHYVPVAPDWQIDLSASYVTSSPGETLDDSDVQSDSAQLAVGVSWQPIRLRQENLILSAELRGLNTDVDILDDQTLTRDRIRRTTARVEYDVGDSLSGYNYATLAVNRGLNILGASEAGDSNLSRAEADPDFTTVQFSYTRLQSLPGDVLAVAQVDGQFASDPLFSSEEFGYGGPSFGRAYDPSEFTGDHGVAASLELRYQGIPEWQEILLSPYAFYDIGKVWNEDKGGVDESAASAGLGLRFKHSYGITANVGLAWPLTQDIENPIYGSSRTPRLLLQLGHQF